jgi:hypothetical protein
MPTYTRFDAVGAREDLSDVIYNISPQDTPIMSSIGKTSAKAVFHEWQTDTLASVNTSNALVEGADATSATLSPTTRIGNYTQIVGKTVQVSGTLEAVDKAGRKSEKAYQLAKASAELKRDIEGIITANQGQSAGNSSTARVMGTLLSYIKTNTNKGSGTTAGADPTTIGVSTRTDGTTRTFQESMLKDVVAKVFTSGGTPSVLMVSPALKQVVSNFTGLAQHRYNSNVSGDVTILGGADLYASDFGILQIVPNRFMRTRDALVLDPEYAALAYLRPFQTIELAKSGDSEKTQILAELTLEVKNEAAHGGIFDLSAS